MSNRRTPLPRVSWSKNLEQRISIGNRDANFVKKPRGKIGSSFNSGPNVSPKKMLCLTLSSDTSSVNGNLTTTSSPVPSDCSDVSEISLDFQVKEKREVKLSLDDINLALDHERSRSQQQSRCETVKAAQTRLVKIYARARQARHGPTDSMSLPSFSRPQTREEVHEDQRGRAKSAVTAPQVRARPSSKVCVRVQSAFSDTTAANGGDAGDNTQSGAVSSLCRQCCEVLGPRACHHCGRIQRRQREMRRFERAYPGFFETDDDVTTAIVLKKYMPDMDVDHIQNLMAQGCLSAPNFRETLVRLKEEAGRKATEAENRRKAMQKSASKGRGNYTFFSSIRDLNQKIVSGRVSKKMGVHWATTNPSGGGTAADPKMPKDLSGARGGNGDMKMSFTELICPMFISPKRLKSEPPGFVAHYEPPLLPSACQNVEPAFFAGSETPYKLPDRLPEKQIDSDESQ